MTQASFYPVIESMPPPPPGPSWQVRPPMPSGVESFDLDIGALDGGRRKKRIATVAFLLLLIGVGGLIAMMVASQAKHGL